MVKRVHICKDVLDSIVLTKVRSDFLDLQVYISYKNEVFCVDYNLFLGEGNKERFVIGRPERANSDNIIQYTRHFNTLQEYLLLYKVLIEGGLVPEISPKITTINNKGRIIYLIEDCKGDLPGYASFSGNNYSLVSGMDIKELLGHSVLDFICNKY